MSDFMPSEQVLSFLRSMGESKNPNAGMGLNNIELDPAIQIQGDNPFYYDTQNEMDMYNQRFDYMPTTRDPAAQFQQGVEPQRNPAVLSKEAQKALYSRIMQEENQKSKMVADYEQRVRDYMNKRQDIIDESQLRMQKLDRIYNDQGPNLQPMAKLMDMASQTNRRNLYDAQPDPRSRYEEQYMQNRISPLQLENLKNALNKQSEAQYGGLTDDATNMLRLGYQSDLARLAIAAQRGKKGTEELITPKMQQAARQDLSRNPLKKGFDQDVKLVRVLKQYRDLLAKSKGKLNRLAGDEAAELNSAYSAAVVAMNRYEADLGALAGGDLDLLKQMLIPTSGVSGTIAQSIKLVNDQTAVKIIDKFVNNGRQRVGETYKDLERTYPTEFGTGSQLDTMRNRLNTISESYKGTPEQIKARVERKKIQDSARSRIRNRYGR